MSDPIFQRGLQDVIKGIRSHKKDASSFISQLIAETKAELRSTDPFIKAEAVRKLTYLQMLGYNVSWASFAIVEVMSQSRFAHKRIGYLAANQAFDEATDVILLTTNLFKKEFASNMNNNQYEIGLAINCLANIATKDLARDCISDLVTLMNHSKPYIRKKAVLAMYKLYVKFPQGLRLTFDKLKDKLDDNESSVVSTAVNVICELANKNPRNYLAMAPKFFRLLTTSSNNWMLIKVVKLLGSLVSEEPRLARKLLEPLATIIQNTGAKSLQYECIYTLTEALPHSTREDGSEAKSAPAVVKLCSDYLRGFIEENDQNLKYLGLVGLVRLMRYHPRSAVEHRDLVLKCLNDDDVTIRTKSLELLAGIVSKKSLVDLVHHLMEHARRSEGSYRDEIIIKILAMCKKDKYSLVMDFAWYISILLDLAIMQGSKHGNEVADQLIEIAMRVEDVRPYAVETMLSMLLNETLVLGQSRETVSQVLKAAAWIIGEYSEIVTRISNDTSNDDDEEEEDDENDDTAYWIEGATGEDIRSVWRGQNVHLMVIEVLLHPRATNLPVPVQNVYIQAAMKIFIRASCDCEKENIADMMSVIRNRLNVFMQSQNLEVQERASTFRHLLSELDILSLHWEDDMEEMEKTTQSQLKKEEKILNLLEMPIYTPSSIKAVDDHGATQAIEKKSILHTIINENFYAVHSKAQRRVPIPEGLDLDKPFNNTALKNLLAIEIPDNLNIHSISIVANPQFNVGGNDIFGSAQHDEEHDRISKVINSSFNDNGEDSSHLHHGNKEDKSGGYNPAASYSSYNAAADAVTGSTQSQQPQQRHGYDDVFMLGGSNRNNAQNDLIPLSKMLGDGFEELPGGGDKKKSKRNKNKDKSSTSKKKIKETNINVTEMLPAGADMGSDDDDNNNTDKKKKKDSSKKNESKRKDSEDMGLDAVDITTPLRADEVLTQPQHRIVPDVIKPSTASATNKEDKEDKKDKKKKKDKSSSSSSKHKDHDQNQDESGTNSKEKKKKDKSTSKSQSQQHTEDNLLGLDWNMSSGGGNSNSVANVEPSKVSSSNSGNHESKEDKKSSKKSSSSSSSGNFWMPCYNDRNIDIFYAIHIESNNNNNKNIQLQFKTSNHTVDGSNISAKVSLSSNGIIRVPGSGGNQVVDLALQLKSGDDHKTSTTLEFANNNTTITDTIVFDCPLQIILESLLGPETTTKSLRIKLYISSTFSSNKLDENSFMNAISKSSSRWASITTQLPISTKPKHAFKALSGFLRAYIIENESNNRAVSMSSKTSSGDTIYYLIKTIHNDTQIQVDIKCLCKDKNDSNQLAESIAKSLTDLSL